MGDEPLVIGHEMAAARAAEARRVASGPGPSPLPAGRYDSGEQRLLDPTRTDLDLALTGFARDYQTCSDAARTTIRDAMGLDDAYTLLSFARRSAVFALRARDPESVQDALAACAAIGYERVDHRDGLVALALLHHAAERCGGDPASLFRAAAALGEPAFGALVEDILARGPAGTHLRDAWGFVEVQGPGGVGLLPWGFRAWDPSLDLVDVSLRVAEALRGDDYDIADPEIAVEVPAIWLNQAGDPALHDILAAARGAAVIHGRLRSGTAPDVESQQLTAWVAELADPAAARHLVDLAATPRPETATLAVAHRPLLALVIGRSFVDGVAGHEAGASLVRFEPAIRAALADYGSQSAGASPAGR